MPVFKATMLITLNTNQTGASLNTRVGGWSESWYTDRTGPDLLPRDFNRLGRLRAALLPNGARIIGQRYQQVDPKGSSSTGSIVFPGTAGIACDIPAMSLFYRARGQGVLNQRPLYIRGIPDARVVEGEYSPSNTYTQALTAFFNGLALWRFRARSLVADATPFLTIQQSAPTVGTYITTIANTWAVDNIVQISGVLVNGRKVEGQFRVSAVSTPQTGTFENWTAGNGTGGKGFFKSTFYPLVEPTSLDPNSGRIVTKKVGRPFGQFRGRASARR